MRTAAAIVVLATGIVAADEIRWVGPPGADWHTPANWETGAIPELDDTAIFDLDATYCVAASQEIFVKNIEIRAGAVEFDMPDVQFTWTQPTFTTARADVMAGPNGEACSLTLRGGRCVHGLIAGPNASIALIDWHRNHGGTTRFFGGFSSQGLLTLDNSQINTGSDGIGADRVELLNSSAIYPECFHANEAVVGTGCTIDTWGFNGASFGLLDCAGTVRTRDYVLTATHTILRGGSLDVYFDSSAALHLGRVEGTGRLSEYGIFDTGSSVETLQPGGVGTIGTIELVQVGITDTLEIDIAGPDSYDRVHAPQVFTITPAAVILPIPAGLRARFTDGYVPVAGDAFEFFTTDFPIQPNSFPPTFEFSQLDLDPLPAGLVWHLDINTPEVWVHGPGVVEHFAGASLRVGTACDIARPPGITISDLLTFLAGWFVGDGDYNASGSTDTMDLLEFLGCWFLN